MIKKEHDLKKLYGMRSELDVQLKIAQIKAAERQRSCSKIRNNIKDLTTQINDLENSEITITEHAILRYLERTTTIDIEDVKKKILNDETALLIGRLGSGRYPISGGLKAVVKGKSIVSVIN